jgi:hypothetical protein
MRGGKFGRRLTLTLTCFLSAGGCTVGGGQPAAESPPPPAPAATAEQRKGSLSTAEGNVTTGIRPGQSVGPLRLGDSREKALEIFGKPEDDYTYNASGDSCRDAEMHWYDAETDSNGLFLYLRNGHIISMAAATPRYSTAEGIKNGSSPDDVRRSYPQLRAYVLVNTASKISGGRDIIYWVDRERGIAFEFYYDPPKRRRYVESVIVFEPGGQFPPNGSCSAAEEWRELKPFALEPSKTGGKRP